MQDSGSMRPTYDHIMPRSKARGVNRGGVIVCYECNQAKGRLLPSQWLRRLSESQDPIDQERAKLMPRVVVKNSSIGWF
jgi:hypothetical protein